MKVATDGPLSIAAVTERARKASLKCTMTNKAPQRAATKAALKADPLVPKQLINRIGAAKKPIAKMVYQVHLQGACSKSPKLKKKIPYPNYNAPSRKKYAKTPFIVYHIYALTKGPLEYSDTWKFGICRQADQAIRRNEQLPKCNKYYAPGRSISRTIRRSSGKARAGSRPVSSRRATPTRLRCRTVGTTRLACLPTFEDRCD